MTVINVLDHNGWFGPPDDADCDSWVRETGLQETVLLRELGDVYNGEETTASAYDGDHFMLFLLDGDRNIRIRWGDAWNEWDLAPTIDDILAGQ